MRGTIPAIFCDGDDGLCGNWDEDFYSANVSSVGGVRITQEHRSPEFTSTADGDFCGECMAKTGDA